MPATLKNRRKPVGDPLLDREKGHYLKVLEDLEVQRRMSSIYEDVNKSLVNEDLSMLRSCDLEAYRFSPTSLTFRGAISMRCGSVGNSTVFANRIVERKFVELCRDGSYLYLPSKIPVVVTGDWHKYLEIGEATVRDFASRSLDHRVLIHIIRTWISCRLI